MARLTRASSFSPTTRMDYSTRRPRAPSLRARAGRNTSGTPIDPFPASWKRLERGGCTTYLPPGWNDAAASGLHGGEVSVVCPQENPLQPVLERTPLTLVTAVVVGGPVSHLVSRGFLPSTNPEPWFNFSKESVAPGGTIDLETNLSFKPANNPPQLDVIPGRTSGEIEVSVNSRYIHARLITPQKIRLTIPQDFPTPSYGAWLLSTSGVNGEMIIRGLGAGSSAGGNLLTVMSLRSDPRSGMIRLTSGRRSSFSRMRG